MDRFGPQKLGGFRSGCGNPLFVRLFLLGIVGVIKRDFLLIRILVIHEIRITRFPTFRHAGFVHVPRRFFPSRCGVFFHVHHRCVFDFPRGLRELFVGVGGGRWFHVRVIADGTRGFDDFFALGGCDGRLAGFSRFWFHFNHNGVVIVEIEKVQGIDARPFASALACFFLRQLSFAKLVGRTGASARRSRSSLRTRASCHDRHRKIDAVHYRVEDVACFCDLGFDSTALEKTRKRQTVRVELLEIQTTERKANLRQ